MNQSGNAAPARARRDPVRLGIASAGTLLLALCALLLLGSSGHRGARAATSGPPAARFVGATVLVAFRAGIPLGSVQRIARTVGARDVRVIGAGTHVLRLTRTGVLSAVASLRRDPQVRYAEPDYIATASAVPSDTSFGMQWGSQNTGQSVPFQDASEVLGKATSGTPGADDRATWAWNTTQGSASVVIGETDTGVDYTHPDLAQNIWSNPSQAGGCPAGTHGYNVVPAKPTCDPMDDDTAYGGHGTHVAGILGAAGDNHAGVAGMNWHTTILPVKWLDSNANGTTAGLISALSWLVTVKQAGVNVRVVNDSATFPGTAYSQALSDEIDALGANNILFVTAAGNTGQNNDTTARYPCSYRRANEICVTASDQNDKIPRWANYGSSSVDLAAPGVSIYSTLRNGNYGWLSGGSMASPQVAGAAALLLSNNPSLSASGVKSAILNNVDPIAGMSGLVRTGGRLDVCKAIPGCQQPALVKTAVPAPGTDGTSATLNGSVSPQNTGTSFYFRYSLNADMSGATTTASQSAGSGGTSQPVSQTVTGLEPNTTYYVQVLATNATETTSGSVLSFRTSSVGPQVSTAPASSLTGSSAVLNGSVNPENSSTTYSFRYSPNADMTGASATGSQSAGSGGTSQPVSQTVTGLEPNTIYYVQVLATNATGTSTGPVVSFATSAPPLAITGAVQSVAPATAVFTASINPQNSPTSYVFDYSPSPDMSGATQVPPDNPLDVGSGNSFAEVSQQVSGLAPDTTYYVQVVATNEASPVRTAVGSVQSFTTTAATTTTTTTTTTTPVPPPPPGATTLPASSLGNSSAVLNGAVNPEHSPTTYTFRYSPHADMSGATQAHGASAAGSDSTAHPESQTLTGLAPKTTYYFQIVATSPAGTTSGSVQSFTTMALSFNGPRPRGPSLSRRVPSGQTLSSLLRRGLTVRVRCGGRCALKAELLLPILVSLAGGRHRTTMTVLGGASRTLSPDHTLQFTITLSRTGRRVLAHSSGATLTLQLSASAGAGKPTTSRLRVTLKRR